ncbi:MAG: ABC transporter permease [Nitrososphaerales archaeon]|nr:ABC transporter permease [Nitrososphaerales archaeon]
MTETLASKAWRKLRTVGALCYYLGIVPMIRIPTLLPFVFATPFTILFILYVNGNPAAFQYGVAGAITMTVSQQGLFLGADLTNYKIEHKFQSMVVASPVTPLTYMFSVALSELVFAAPAVAILLAVVASTTSGIAPVAILQILAVVLMTWVTTSSIGFFLSTYLLNTRTAFLTVSFISILLSILPPVFYPIRVIPEQVRWLASLVPTTHSSVLIQNAVGLPVAGSEATVSWLALPAFTATFLLLALYKAKWREN